MHPDFYTLVFIYCSGKYALHILASHLASQSKFQMGLHRGVQIMNLLWIPLRAHTLCQSYFLVNWGRNSKRLFLSILHATTSYSVWSQQAKFYKHSFTLLLQWLYPLFTIISFSWGREGRVRRERPGSVFTAIWLQNCYNCHSVLKPSQWVIYISENSHWQHPFFGFICFLTLRVAI